MVLLILLLYCAATASGAAAKSRSIVLLTSLGSLGAPGASERTEDAPIPTDPPDDDPALEPDPLENTLSKIFSIRCMYIAAMASLPVMRACCCRRSRDSYLLPSAGCIVDASSNANSSSEQTDPVQPDLRDHSNGPRASSGWALRRVVSAHPERCAVSVVSIVWLWTR